MNISKTKWYSFFNFKNSTPVLIGVVFCLILSSFLGVKTPFLIVNLSKSYDSSTDFYFAIKELIMNFFYVYLTRVVYQLLVNKYVRMLIQYARSSIYEKWINAYELEIEKYPQGEIISRIMSDTEAIRDLITSGAFGIFVDLAFVISCLSGFIKLHYKSGLYLSLSEVLATLFLFWGSALMRDMFLKLRNSQAKVNRVTANVLGGFSQIFYTRHDHYALKKSVQAFDEFLENQHKVNSMDAFYYAIAESLYPILLALVVFIFPYSKITEVALLFAIIDLIQRSINPIKEMSGKMANIQRARTGIDRMIHFLSDLDDSSALKSTTKKIEIKNDLKFNCLKVDIDQFEYVNSKINDQDEAREKFQLKDIHFEGKTGDLIGIVGISGSGKTTLLNIIAGVLKSGPINIMISTSQGDIPIADFENYMQQVSLVSQDSHIFSESLFFNLTLSINKDQTIYDQYEEFKKALPYLVHWGIELDDQIIPQKLSLGQKQLIAGIRSLILKKNIVCFDEISSALDPDLEFSLRKLIQLIQTNSLTIIVAHRIETITNADLILVMDNGRVIESGKHSELLNMGKIYQNLVQEMSHS